MTSVLQNLVLLLFSLQSEIFREVRNQVTPVGLRVHVRVRPETVQRGGELRNVGILLRFLFWGERILFISLANGFILATDLVVLISS